MQNSETLKSLNATHVEGSKYKFVGKHKVFWFTAYDKETPPFVSMSVEVDLIDNRPLSDNFGKPFRKFIKDCQSNGSVSRAIDLHDVP